MLVKLLNVQESAAGRTYATDITGRALFPRTKDMEIKQGDYAYVIETLQTKTRDEQGELIDLAVPVKVLTITATFATKAEAIAASNEAALIELEAKAELQKTAKELNVSEAAIARMMEVDY